jgi:prepilin-type N-terminal cleavage/methylation domain-containing protein
MKFLQRKRHLGKRGFTLIELIVVIAVIGILVLLAAPKFLGYTKDAKVAALQADAKVLSNAALQYNIKEEVWPTSGTFAFADPTAEALEANLPAGVTEANLAVIDAVKLEPYVKNLANDFADYVLVVSGDFEGEVFHLDGQADADGDVWFGTSLEVVAP